MRESFASILTVGAHRNSLGRAQEVVDTTLRDHTRLAELYDCIFDTDPYVRMRAIDSFEKVGRVHPDWIVPYIDRLLRDVAPIDQASIQWHLAEIFAWPILSPTQRRQAIILLKRNVADTTVDWIVAANTMKTLVAFVHSSYLPAADVIPLLHIQQTHHSNAVVKRAGKLLDEISE